MHISFACKQQTRCQTSAYLQQPISKERDSLWLFFDVTVAWRYLLDQQPCNLGLISQALAKKMAALEKTEAAMVTSSGMAAISTTLLTLLKAGDHMLIQQSLYGGTEMFVTKDLPDFGISYTKVDADKPEAWAAEVKANTRVSC